MDSYWHYTAHLPVQLEFKYWQQCIIHSHVNKYPESLSRAARLSWGHHNWWPIFILYTSFWLHSLINNHLQKKKRSFWVKNSLAIRDTWSESVRDFQIFVGPVRDSEIFVGPGPVRSQVLKFFSVLVRFEPRFRIFSWFWFGPVPGSLKISRSWSELVRDLLIFSVVVRS